MMADCEIELPSLLTIYRDEGATGRTDGGKIVGLLTGAASTLDRLPMRLVTHLM